jgi:hypothetical protein
MEGEGRAEERKAESAKAEQELEKKQRRGE